MPLEKRERPGEKFADGRIRCTFTVAARQHEANGGHLPFDVWFFTEDVSIPAMVVNPTLDITLFHSLGNASWRSQDGVRLPVLTGDAGNHGWIMESNAVTWSPFAPLSTELVRALDALRHPEFGFKAQLKLNAVVLPLAEVPERPGRRPTPTLPKRFVWHDDFTVSNEIWREWLAMMGHPRARVFELHPLSFSDLSEFDLACGKLRDAERQFFLGHWAQAIALSRSVVEAIFRHLGYKGEKSYDWASIEAAGLPKEMAALFKAFNNVANLENHPTGDHGWRRADARFMLHLAATLAEYAGTLPQK